MTPLQVARPIVLDLLAAIAFASAFFIAKNAFGFPGLVSVYIATAAGIAIGVIQFLHKKFAREPIGPLQWLSLGVVVTLGTMTLALHDEHFIKLKPTVIDFAVGIFMATRDWMTPYLPPDMRRHLSRRIIARASNAWAALMLAFAAVNAVFAFFADFSVWAIYATFVPPVIIVIVFLIQYSLFQSLARRNAQACEPEPASQA